MGRPLPKKFFGTGAGSIRVRAKIGTNAEGDGHIIRQRSSNKFEVQVGANKGVCKLVTKANGALVAGDMTISVLDDAGVVRRVKKVLNRVVILENNVRGPWTFTTNASDKKVEIEEDGGADNFV